MGGDVSQSCFSLSNLHFPNVSYAVFDRKLSVQTNVEKLRPIHSYLVFYCKSAQLYQHLMTVSHNLLTPVK